MLGPHLPVRALPDEKGGWNQQTALGDCYRQQRGTEADDLVKPHDVVATSPVSRCSRLCWRATGRKYTGRKPSTRRVCAATNRYAGRFYH